MTYKISNDQKSGGIHATSSIPITLGLMCISIGLWVVVSTSNPYNISSTLIVSAWIAVIGLVAYGEIVERNREPNRSNISLLGNVVAAWLILLALGVGPAIFPVVCAMTFMFFYGIYQSFSKNGNLIN